MDEQELEGMLKPFGQVISTRILRDTTGTSRGVGFARWGISRMGNDEVNKECHLEDHQRNLYPSPKEQIIGLKYSTVNQKFI